LGWFTRCQREAFRLLHVSTDEVYGSLTKDHKPLAAHEKTQ
jgi:dTDP-D-glucose 4,6-dehydratase